MSPTQRELTPHIDDLTDVELSDRNPDNHCGGSVYVAPMVSIRGDSDTVGHPYLEQQWQRTDYLDTDAYLWKVGMPTVYEFESDPPPLNAMCRSEQWQPPPPAPREYPQVDWASFSEAIITHF